MHHTKDKGGIGCLAVAADLAKKGYKLLAPMTEHLPFDLVAYDEALGTFHRIQCKYRTLVGQRVKVKLTTSYSTKHGVQSNRYALDAFDVLAVYCPDLDKIAYIAEKDLLGHANSVTIQASGKGRTFEKLAEFPKPK